MAALRDLERHASQLEEEIWYTPVRNSWDREKIRRLHDRLAVIRARIRDLKAAA